MRALDVHFHRRWSLPCASPCKAKSRRLAIEERKAGDINRETMEDAADCRDQRYCVTDSPHTAAIPRSNSASACGNDRPVFRNSAKKPPPSQSGLSWNSLHVDAKFPANACRCETERAPSWRTTDPRPLRRILDLSLPPLSCQTFSGKVSRCPSDHPCRENTPLHLVMMWFDPLGQRCVL